jgi:hypothetical protein
MKLVRKKAMTISERETSGKRKVSKSRLIGHHEAELKKGKDGWDFSLNVPTSDNKIAIRVATKPSQMH